MTGKEALLVPCFLCGDGLEVKDTKRGKPCFHCDPCGLQVFVRRKKGIELLRTLTSRLEKDLMPNAGGGRMALVVRALLNRREELRAELREVEDKRAWSGLIRRDTALDAAAEALKREIRGVEGQLRKLSR